VGILAVRTKSARRPSEIRQARFTQYCAINSTIVSKKEQNYINKYQRYKRAARLRHKKWALSMLGGRCVECGEVSESLEFDHIDPTTMSLRIAWNLHKPRNSSSLSCTKLAGSLPAHA
jgi:hypothetical protein